MSDYMLDFSDENLDGARDLMAADEGEYRVRIKDWKTDDDGKIVKLNDDDKPFIMPILEIVNHPDADYFKDFTHFLWLPDSWMDSKKKNKASFDLREFLNAFGIDYHQKIDPESTIGAEADAYLIMTDDDQYGEQNRVKKFVTSH